MFIKWFKVDFIEDGVINRVLLFLIENNFFFNLFDSMSFLVFLKYMNL